MPLSQVYLYTDGLIVLTAGAIFGWEVALYALLTLFIGGIASDYTLEGPSSVRTVTIITNRAAELSQALMTGLGRGLSQWEITGSYTGETHMMLSCTIYRTQVNGFEANRGQRGSQRLRDNRRFASGAWVRVCTVGNIEAQTTRENL